MGKPTGKRRRNLRLSWLFVIAFCLGSLILRSSILTAISGLMLAAWSAAVAQNRFGMMETLRDRGRASAAFDQPETSYRAIGYFGTLIGLGWFALSVARFF
jgi:hypothetical protein